jgi:hypothetical protein
LLLIYSEFLSVNLQLVAVEGTSQGKPSATLSVQKQNVSPTHIKRTVEGAKNDLEARQLGIPGVGVGDFAAGLKEIMAKLDIIIRVGDAVSEVRTIIPMYKPPINVPPRSIRTPRPRGSY